VDDLLLKGQFKGLDIAFTYAVTTAAVNELTVLHNCDPAAAHLLGRALTSALLSAVVLPENHRLNVCWKYPGALQTLLVDAGQDGTVRGFIVPPQLHETENAGDALYGESGTLRVITTDSSGKIINSGTAPVALQDVVRDLAFFHCTSQQVETGLSVLIGFNADPLRPVQLCQGWMLQALPGASLERFERLRQRMESPAFRARLARTSEADGWFETLANTLADDEPGFAGVTMDAGPTPRFFCPCTREKMNAVVRTLPIPERMELVLKKEPVVIHCQFCNRRYELSIEECIAAWNARPTQ
jgi:molecular chaperone Hsp33